MRQLLIVLATITLCQSANCQTGSYEFHSTNGDTCRHAKINIGYDYLKVVEYEDTGELPKIPKESSTIFAFSPNYNFTVGDDSHYWLSQSTNKVNFLGKYNPKTKKFVYMRINGKKYR